MSTYSFRITTNGVMRNYRSNLMKSRKQLNTASERVQTRRNYNSYAEDPTSASRAFQLRRSLWRTNDAIDNTNHAIGVFTTAFTAMDSIVDGNSDHPGFDGVKQALELLNDPTGTGRDGIGQTLMSTADSIVQMMNTTYAENFVFAGADGHNVPFTWGQNGNGERVLLFRGIDVNTPDPEVGMKPVMKEVDAQYQTDLAQYESDLEKYNADKDAWLAEDPGNRTEADWLTQHPDVKEPVPPDDPSADDTQAAYKAAFEEKYGMSVDTAKANYEKLVEMSKETTYVDIGIGFEEDADGTVPTSAYNTALSGLNILGFGVDENGDSLNMVTLMRELGEIGQNIEPKSGMFSADPEENREIAARANTLTLKLRTCLDNVSEKHVELTAKTGYLKSNLTQLNNSWEALNTQRADIEDINPALAIHEMTYANTCYQAALKIGNSLLSQSLIDYMD